MADLYQTLGVLPTAMPDEITTAYARERARLIAQEAAAEAGNPGAAGQLQALDEAYATLSDASRRAAYDRSAGGGSSPGALIVSTQPNAIVVPQTPVPVVQQACPHCGALNPVQATMCSQCGQQVSRSCPNCGQPVLLNQTVCPRCNTVLKEYDLRRYAEAVVVEKYVNEDRSASEARVQAAEAVHRVRAVQGMFFWLVVCGTCVGLMVLAVLAFNYFLQRNP